MWGALNPGVFFAAGDKGGGEPPSNRVLVGSVVIASKSPDLQHEVLALFAGRKGHFRFESGHHGDLWLDIPSAYIRPNRVRRFAVELARMLGAHNIEAVCGPLVEGALLAQMVAEELGVEFYFAEQFPRASSDGLYPIGYRLPESMRYLVSGKRIAIVDDIINAGSAVRGTAEDLQVCGAEIVAIGALLVLDSSASTFAASKGLALETLSEIPKNNLWEPSSCPLCGAGVTLEELRPTSQ